MGIASPERIFQHVRSSPLADGKCTTCENGAAHRNCRRGATIRFETGERSEGWRRFDEEAYPGIEDSAAKPDLVGVAERAARRNGSHGRGVRLDRDASAGHPLSAWKEIGAARTVAARADDVPFMPVGNGGRTDGAISGTRGGVRA